MKKIALSLTLAVIMLSCNSTKTVSTTTMANAATMLSSLTSNSTVQQISNLFTLLDTNNDASISSTEAIGSVADNFSTLDTDSSSSLNLTELTGLLGLLK